MGQGRMSMGQGGTCCVDKLVFGSEAERTT